MNLPKNVYSLTSAAKYFGIKLNNNIRHTALYDAELTAKVYLKLKEYTKKGNH